MHALIFKTGFKTLISQVFLPSDPHLEDDVQFRVRSALIGDLVVPEEDGPDRIWYSMDHAFVMDVGKAKLPTPPIR